MLLCQKLKKQPLSPQKVLTVGYLETIEDKEKLSIQICLFFLEFYFYEQKKI